MLRLPRAAAPTSLGTTVPVVILIVTAALFTLSMGFVLLVPLLSANGAHIVANLWLLAVLGAVTIVWLFCVARGWVGAATGSGLTLAGYALAVRILCEFGLSIVGEPVRIAFPDHPILLASRLARYGGLVAYVFGLACVLAACIRDRRVGPRRSEHEFAGVRS